MRSVVRVELRGEDLPALIWKGKRSTEKWLSADDRLAFGNASDVLCHAEFVDGVWLLGPVLSSASIQQVATGKRRN